MEQPLNDKEQVKYWDSRLARAKAQDFQGDIYQIQELFSLLKLLETTSSNRVVPAAEYIKLMFNFAYLAENSAITSGQHSVGKATGTLALSVVQVETLVNLARPVPKPDNIVFFPNEQTISPPDTPDIPYSA